MRVFLICAAALLGSPAPMAADGIDPAAPRTYIVRLSEAPLASYRGADGDPLLKRRAPEPTSPAALGSARLDLGSKAVNAYREFLRERRDQVLAEAVDELGRAVEVGFVYDAALHGFSTVLSANEAARLAKLPGIAQVEPEFIDRLQTDAGPAWVGAPAVWNQAGGGATRGEGVVVGIIDSGINFSHASFAATSPVDGYQHVNPRGQSFGLCATGGVGCNSKLIGIHDFSLCTGVHASTECNDREPNTGADPDGHGSHVASTAVGNPLQTSIPLPTGAVTRSLSGVAPRANLIAYKACEEEEDCRGSWLLAAINQAVLDGVSVINYSIGSTEPRSPWTASDGLAFLAARDAGIVVVVSAGNSGPGRSTIASPADAPWVLAVANATHDRAIVNRLLDLSGGASAPPSGGVLVGDGFTAGFGPAPIVVPTDFPLCGTGSGLDSPPTGASNPWPAGRFAGEIVLCLRGTQARIAKSNNVRLAGGGGMVLINQAADGESTVADEHSIPSTHLGASDGAALRQWLASGSGHRGRLEGVQIRSEASRGDLLNTSSSRGPTIFGDYLKPDLSAPGTAVLAAAGEGPDFAFLTGTSMASPHVAGAAALLRAQKPSWTPSDVESALRTSAVESILSAPATRATPLEQGSGRLSVPAALRAGLSFAVTRAEFNAANPFAAGAADTLNLPSLVDLSCFERCQFTRRVTDLRGGGRWRASVDAEAGMQVSVSPGEFTLAAGATQALQVSAEVSAPRLLGRELRARIRLTAIDAAGTALSSVSPSDLPLLVKSDPGPLPTEIALEVGSDRGFADVLMTGLAALGDLAPAATALAAPTISTATLGADFSASDPYNGFTAGSLISLVTLPATTEARRYRLQAIARSDTSRDMDVFIGLDADADGLPEQNEELCRSVSPFDAPNCVLELTSGASARSYWVLLQNVSASFSGPDVVQLETQLFDLEPVNGPKLVVTGPATVARLGSFNLRLAWDDPSFAPGETRRALLQLRAGGSSEPLGMIPVSLRRTTGTTVGARVLASGETVSARIAAGTAADRWVIDVPEGADELIVQSVGAEIDLYLAAGTASGDPRIPAAPAREAALRSARGAELNKQISLSSAQGLRGGRWYVTAVNTATGTASFQLRTELRSSIARAPWVSGAYFNPARDGSGVFLFPGGGTLGLLWYTYLQDRTPTWYIASAPAPASTAGHWTAPLFRARWNGVDAPLTEVGRVTLSQIDARIFRFGWTLDGESGSEPYGFIDGGGCARDATGNVDINGFWFNPAAPGYGYSVNAFPGVETNGAYFFDANGVGRWALGAVSPFGADTLRFDLRLGACPGCDYSAPSVLANIGQLVRTYTSTAAGRMNLDLQLPAPLSGRWQVDSAVQKITDATGCR